MKCRPQVSRDGKLVAAPCGVTGVILFDVATGEALRTLSSPSGDVRGVAFSPDGKRLAAFSWGPGKVRVWNLADKDNVLFTTDADDSITFDPVFSPDGTRLVVAECQPVGSDSRVVRQQPQDGATGDGLARSRFADDTQPLAADVEVGNLSINHFVASVAETPFGGVKESGYGREGGTEGLQCYTVTKNVSHKTI